MQMYINFMHVCVDNYKNKMLKYMLTPFLGQAKTNSLLLHVLDTLEFFFLTFKISSALWKGDQIKRYTSTNINIVQYDIDKGSSE